MQHTFTSGGQTIRLVAHEPGAAGRHPAILLLHGSGGGVNYWVDRIAPAITTRGIAVFAVHYFDRTGTTRAVSSDFTDNLHVPAWLETIRDTLAHLATRPAVDPNRIALVGISLGAFLALAVAASTPLVPPLRAVVEISGGLVPPFEAQADAAFPPTLLLHGDQDTVVSATYAHQLDALLTRIGVDHELKILRGEGHFFSPAAQFRMLAAVSAFLGRHL